MSPGNQRPYISLIDRVSSVARRVPYRARFSTTVPRWQNTAPLLTEVSHISHINVSRYWARLTLLPYHGKTL